METVQRQTAPGTVVAVPVYRSELQWQEEISLRRLFQVLGGETIVFFAPEGLELPESLTQGREVRRFPASAFSSLAAYNELLLQEAFYAAWQDFEHILICQLDAFVFSNRLAEFCALGFDYLGAPWYGMSGLMRAEGRRVQLRVGNGGFSLRRVAACRALLAKYPDIARRWLPEPEDLFLAWAGKTGDLRVADLGTARRFACEMWAGHVYRHAGQMPFGCHGWARYSAEFYAWALAVAGVKLKPSERAGLRTEEEASFRLFCRQRRSRKGGEAF